MPRQYVDTGHEQTAWSCQACRFGPGHTARQTMTNHSVANGETNNLCFRQQIVIRHCLLSCGFPLWPLSSAIFFRASVTSGLPG